MRSNNLSSIDGPARQGLLPVTIPTEQVSVEVIRRLTSMSKAIALCIQVSGLDEKQAYKPLDIDAGHWTRIMKGDAHFPVNKLNDLCDLCGNEIPLEWWAWSRGKGLHMLESEAERKLRIANEELAKVNERLAYVERLMVGKAGM